MTFGELNLAQGENEDSASIRKRVERGQNASGTPVFGNQDTF
ncbi:MAG: hypothetical protein ACLR0U_01425 [Enterocloster clostridioformis]